MLSLKNLISFLKDKKNLIIQDDIETSLRRDFYIFHILDQDILKNKIGKFFQIIKNDNDKSDLVDAKNVYKLVDKKIDLKDFCLKDALIKIMIENKINSPIYFCLIKDVLKDSKKIKLTDIIKSFNLKRLNFEASSNLPTKFGDFSIKVYLDLLSKKELVVLSKGKIKDNIFVRMHSECITSESFNSLRCDCKQQFDDSMELISKNDGMIIYLRQEGRGIGLINKIKAYKLQDEGLDTVDANLHLGFDDDLRNYDIAIEILQEFKLKEIRLLTNNPKKILSVKEAGIKVSRAILTSKVNEHNKHYLDTKNKKSNHMINKDN